jgi:hypothetical protein
MNQKVVIYIILSAILLYLYYRNRDIRGGCRWDITTIVKAQFVA